MTVKDAINALQQLPPDAELAILDTRRNNYYADAEPSSEGIYEPATIELIGGKDIPDGTAPWVALTFDNRDFDEGEENE